MIDTIVNLVLLSLLAGAAIGIFRARSLFVATMLSGIFSLLCAGIFLVFDAVDVAFTEAAVGGGIATVLFLGSLSLTGRDHALRRSASLTSLFLVLLTGGLLIYGTLDMPMLGSPDAVVHQHVAPRYLEQSGEEIGILNVVTSVLASYRGYDTLGEVTVIFTAGVGVVALLGRRSRVGKEKMGNQRG